MTGGVRQVAVWDLATRLFHWLTAALVLAAYIFWRCNWMDWHAWSGDAVLVLVLFRVVWGVVGSETARFAGFLATPRVALRHLAGLFRREPDQQVGHNAAGGWMVVLLLVLLLAEALTGIVVNNDVADVGPLTDIMPVAVANLIDDLHALLWRALLAAVLLHVAAIALYAVAKGHDLVRPMMTGRKRLSRHVPPPRMASAVRAVLVLGASAIVAGVLATYL